MAYDSLYVFISMLVCITTFPSAVNCRSMILSITPFHNFHRYLINRIKILWIWKIYKRIWLLISSSYSSFQNKMGTITCNCISTMKEIVVISYIRTYLITTSRWSKGYFKFTYQTVDVRVHLAQPSLPRLFQ